MSCEVFKSSTYSCKMLQNLRDLWQNGWFCDVELSCDGELFKAHRTILASSSSYFRAMFTGGMAEENKSQIEIKSISCSIFSTLLSFIYTGEILLSTNSVQEILTAADMLGLPEIVESCTDYLKNELHPSNALGIYRFAEQHMCKNLEKFSSSYIFRHFPQVYENEEFVESPKDVLVQFLGSEKLKVDSEFQVLAAALRWLTYDVTARKQFVFEILSHIRFPLIPSRLLQECIISMEDLSLQIALKSIQKDLSLKRGSLVSLMAQPRKCAKKHIYVIGGSRKEVYGWRQLTETTLDSVVCFDTFQKKWTDISPMEIERILPGVAALEGLIYVVGGEQESKILANGEVYNPSEDVWTQIEAMVIPRCAFGLATWENYLYAFGGWVGEDIGGSIERYDPYSNEWTMIGDMEEPKFSMGICSHEGLIYMVGGCTHKQRHVKTLLSFNPFTSEWTNLSPLKYARSQMGIAILDNYLYAIGGSSKHGDVLKSVERYNFEEDKWQEVASMRVGRANSAVGAVDGKIYCIGGTQTLEENFFRAQVTIASMEVYDPHTDTWDDCNNLADSRSEAGYVVI